MADQCYCRLWGNTVLSPSGPWIPKSIIDQLVRERLRSPDDVDVLGPTATQSADGGAADTNGGQQSGGSGRTASSPIARASGEESAKASASESSAVPSLRMDALAFLRSLITCCFEPVPAEVVAALPESSHRGHTGILLRLKDRIDFSAFPGLREQLYDRHRTVLAQDGVDAEDVLRLLENGGVCGKIAVQTIADPSHPLRKLVTGSVAGTFATQNVTAGECLGFYPGILTPMRELGGWLSKLPAQEQKVAWSYDIASPMTNHSFHGYGVRNVLSGVNDYHGIDLQGASVKKIALRLGGVIPLVMFVANRDVPQGRELTLSYGKDWVATFLKYFPEANYFFSTASQEPTMMDILNAYTTSIDKRTRSSKKPAATSTGGSSGSPADSKRGKDRDSGKGDAAAPRKDLLAVAGELRTANLPLLRQYVASSEAVAATSSSSGGSSRADSDSTAGGAGNVFFRLLCESTPAAELWTAADDATASGPAVSPPATPSAGVASTEGGTTPSAAAVSAALDEAAAPPPAPVDTAAAAAASSSASTADATVASVTPSAVKAKQRREREAERAKAAEEAALWAGLPDATLTAWAGHPALAGVSGVLGLCGALDVGGSSSGHASHGLLLRRMQAWFEASREAREEAARRTAELEADRAAEAVAVEARKKAKAAAKASRSAARKAKHSAADESPSSSESESEEEYVPTPRIPKPRPPPPPRVKPSWEYVDDISEAYQRTLENGVVMDDEYILRKAMELDGLSLLERLRLRRKGDGAAEGTDEAAGAAKPKKPRVPRVMTPEELAARADRKRKREEAAAAAAAAKPRPRQHLTEEQKEELKKKHAWRGWATIDDQEFLDNKALQELEATLTACGARRAEVKKAVAEECERLKAAREAKEAERRAAMAAEEAAEAAEAEGADDGVDAEDSSEEDSDAGSEEEDAAMSSYPVIGGGADSEGEGAGQGEAADADTAPPPAKRARTAREIEEAAEGEG